MFSCEPPCFVAAGICRLFLSVLEPFLSRFFHAYSSFVPKLFVFKMEKNELQGKATRDMSELGDMNTVFTFLPKFTNRLYGRSALRNKVT